ncbi:MAG: hypothetical protein K8F91_05940, partial [Candidatus Obscuribacterales bacterium]|nr:hypothetical protein [Candidatus Obscuribacterales bacterium]
MKNKIKQTAKTIRISLPELAARGYLLALIVVLAIAGPTYADPTPMDLIPPDVTLSPNAASKNPISATSVAIPDKATQDNAPGLGSQQLPYAKGRGVYGGASMPAPPPTGSSAFSGFKTPPANQPEGDASAQSQTASDPLAVIETERGTITMRIFSQYAPKT